MPTALPRRVAIVGANRIPFARSNTAYAQLTNKTMLTDTLRGLVEKLHLQGELLGEVVGGAVMKHSRDWNMVRECVLSSGLSPNTPAFDVQQACGTGLEAAILVANKIALGQIDAGIACGVDTTSDAPVAVNRGLQRALMDLNAAKTTSAKLKHLMRAINPKHLVPELPANAEPRTGKSMGQHAEITAKRYGISREAQDALALASHQNLARAYDEGFFDDLVMPYHGLKRDNNLRPDSSLEKLAKLAPAFDRNGGTITAANASPLTDGASAVLLASEEWAQKKGLPILAYLVTGEVAAVDFIDEREGLLMAPAYAIPRMLARLGLTLQDFDFYEIHEAFAAVVLCTLAAWESDEFCRTKLGLPGALGSIDRCRLNVKGSSIAAGHPFAATGGRVVATLAKLLAEKGSGRGLISICAAGGQGVTAILER
ncbi:acetyl-CoA C-acetyltransferase [Niveibacterium microcysteis]|uniref:Acetyl-CoA C-acetyltransferase n=1 Tax=Niveibacterium microcysteis TaxID=2811415 RepID=A0ABX7M2H7_9RHOO|nr:acetyl-CoA C-acetyltransferase [Niveibacterium microcysteis]QSI75969.1 acetyl-CoA C-acetyltransferase [Niveibacterium microcysteis]